MFSKNIIGLIIESLPGEREYRITRLKNLEGRCELCEIPFPLKIEDMSLKELERKYVSIRREIEEREKQYTGEGYQGWNAMKIMSYKLYDRVKKFDIESILTYVYVGSQSHFIYVNYFNFEYEIVIISRMIKRLNELYMGRKFVFTLRAFRKLVCDDYDEDNDEDNGDEEQHMIPDPPHPFRFEGVYLDILKEITGGKCVFNYQEEKSLRCNPILKEDFIKLRKLMTMTENDLKAILDNIRPN